MGQVVKSSKLLRYNVETAKGMTFRLGEPIQIKATLFNLASYKVAIYEGDLFRYCNYERLPKTEDGFSTEGQVTGDSPSDARARPPTVLGAKESFTKEIDLVRLVTLLAREPGKYRISFDYCHDGHEVLKGIPVPQGCVRSNDLLLEVIPSDRS